MKKLTYLLLMIAGVSLFSCNTDDKSGNGQKNDDNVEMSKNIIIPPIFKTTDEMVKIKNALVERLGSDIQLNDIAFRQLPVSNDMHLINKAGDSVTYYTYKEGKLIESYVAPFKLRMTGNIEDEVFTFNDIPFDNILTALNKSLKKYECKEDSCIVDYITVRKSIQDGKFLIKYNVGIDEYKNGEKTILGKIITIDKDGSILEIL